MEYIEWPGLGKAYRLMPRGMSDYQRMTIKRYITDSGHQLHDHNSRWSAHYKEIHTKEFDSAEEAILRFNDILRSKSGKREQTRG